jgi:hypothetical protein
MVRQSADQIDEVTLRIDAEQPTVFHQGKEVGQPRTGFGVAHE